MRLEYQMHEPSLVNGAKITADGVRRVQNERDQWKELASLYRQQAEGYKGIAWADRTLHLAAGALLGLFIGALVAVESPACSQPHQETRVEQ